MFRVWVNGMSWVRLKVIVRNMVRVRARVSVKGYGLGLVLRTSELGLGFGLRVMV